MAHKFIDEINPGETVNDIYLVKEPVLRSTTRGDFYIAMYLMDKTGQVNGRMWQATETAYNSLPKPGFIQVQGRSELYQNNLQVVVNQFKTIPNEKVNLEDFLARTDKDIPKMFEEVKQIVSKIKNPQIKMLIDEFLADKVLMDNFCKAPAAMRLHHSYLGGLLEHVNNMLNVAAAFFPYYPKIQSDLVLAGIFLHDIGKTEELCYDITFSYTDAGQLIGHITKSLLMLHRKVDVLAAKGKAVDSQVLDAIGHIILSHHGKYEFGSPKLPATAEAFMVNYIDDLDAKIAQVTALIESDDAEANWTSWQKTLETKLYRKRID